MARSFRYYGKKRGHRRTGSPQAARIGEAIFFAVFLLFGCVGLAMLFSTAIVPEWCVNHEFVETTCKVIGKKVGDIEGEDGPLYRPEIEIEYEVAGVTYRHRGYDIHDSYSSGRKSAEAVLGSFDLYSPERKNTYPCWYDPRDPRVAVLARGYDGWVWLMLTVPLSFIAIGGGGLLYALLHRGKSAECRAAMMQRAQERDFFSIGGGERECPFIPQGADMTNSPGTRLRFRLPIGASDGWTLFGALAFCLIWNGLVSIFVVMAVRSHLAGRPEWFLTFFVIPFVLIGLAAIVMFLRQLLVTTGVGPTFMEISSHPLYPGEQLRLFLSQSGRLTMNSLQVALVCEEAATYRQGTNTRRETQEVYRQKLFCREGFEIQGGLPFEAEFELSVPPGAMHSFKSDHNEINWSVLVEGDVARWSNYKRCFPVIVYPAPAGADR